MALIPLRERSIEPETVEEMPSYREGKRVTLAPPVSDLVYDLIADAREAGYESPQFDLISGYRSIAQQQVLWDRKLREVGGDEELADDWVARPGRSSHHTGFAFDINLGVGGAISARRAEIEASEEYQYMRDVLAPKYNLTQLPNEPWHWECDEDCRQIYVARKLGELAEAERLENSRVTEPSGQTFKSVVVLLGATTLFFVTARALSK